MRDYKSASRGFESVPSGVQLRVPPTDDRNGEKAVTDRLQHSPAYNHPSDDCRRHFHGCVGFDAGWTFKALAVAVVSVDGVGCVRGSFFDFCHHLLRNL